MTSKKVTDEELLQYIEESGLEGVSQSDIKDYFSLSKSSISERVKNLLKAGLIIKESIQIGKTRSNKLLINKKLEENSIDEIEYIPTAKQLAAADHILSYLPESRSERERRERREAEAKEKSETSSPTNHVTTPSRVPEPKPEIDLPQVDGPSLESLISDPKLFDGTYLRTIRRCIRNRATKRDALWELHDFIYELMRDGGSS